MAIPTITLTDDDLQAMMEREGVTYDELKERAENTCCWSHAFGDTGLDILWTFVKDKPDRFR